MSRLRSLLLLGGTVLVMSYISAPASPTPPPHAPSEAQVRAIDAMAPVAMTATQEAAQLRARLAILPQNPQPRRDPFTFGSTPRAPKRVIPVEPAPVVEVIAPAPALMWPKLVALLTDNGKVTAVLGLGDTVEIVKAGDSMGGFLVREITASAIEVVHVATSTSQRLTLR
jgi:hypothetical protein